MCIASNRAGVQQVSVEHEYVIRRSVPNILQNATACPLSNVISTASILPSMEVCYISLGTT